jgi:hypothetical protein
MGLFGSKHTLRSELAGLSDEEVARLAQDVGMHAVDFRAMAEQELPRAAELFVRMADVGLDASEVATSERAVMRDLERVCSLCKSKSQCNYDFQRGITGIPDYCQNKDTFVALIAERQTR